MIKFKSLLKENPDTVYYKKRTYKYSSPANRCAFLIYPDKLSGKQTLFGYSDDKGQFYSDDPEVLTDIKDLKNGEQIKNQKDATDKSLRTLYWAQQGVKQLESGNDGGGHLQLENILEGIERYDDENDDVILKGRIFEVIDTPAVIPPNLDIKIESTIPSGKAIIVSFWDNNISAIVKYKNKYEKIIEFCGYDPKECLYEPGSKFLTYDQLYGGSSVSSVTDKPTSTTTVGDVSSKHGKPGDIVKIKGLDVKAEILSISGGNANLKVTDSKLPQVPVGSEFPFPLRALEPDDVEDLSNISLEDLYDKKNLEYVDLSGEFHPKKSKLTKDQIERYEEKLYRLEVEKNVIQDLLNSGVKDYTDDVKNKIDAEVERKVHIWRTQERYSLAAQAEKQYGMPIAQLRQKFRGVPLDQLVKKESLYKRLLKALRG